MGGAPACDRAAFEAGKCIVYEPHPSIFAMSGAANFDGMHVATTFTILVLFTIIVEQLMERLEVIISRRESVYHELGSKIVKELMILGLVSFAIFIGEQAFHLNTTEYYLPLEFSHIIIFVMALIYVLGANLILGAIVHICAFWDSCLSMSADQMDQMAYKELGDSSDWTGSWIQRNGWTSSHVKRAAEMRIVHAAFIRKHRLPPNFDFGRYLLNSLTDELSDVLDISVGTWTFVIAVVWALYTIGMSLELGKDELLYAFLLAGWAMGAAVWVVLRVSMRARARTVCLSLGVDIDGQAARTYTPDELVEIAKMTIAGESFGTADIEAYGAAVEKAIAQAEQNKQQRRSSLGCGGAAGRAPGRGGRTTRACR
jgi:hypothetical protein